MAATVQSHLHVDTDSPPTTTYAATKRTPIHKAYIALGRALDGTLRRGSLASAGVPIVFTDYVYQIKVTQAELATISALLGRTVNLIDSIHDAADHAAGTRSVVFRSLVNVTSEGVASKATLDYFLATVEFEDNETV